jgi:hypothetical protein
LACVGAEAEDDGESNEDDESENNDDFHGQTLSFGRVMLCVRSKAFAYRIREISVGRRTSIPQWQ